MCNDYDNEYALIYETGNVNHIKQVSHLRHYMNIYGITKELINKFNLSEEQFSHIYDICQGNVMMSSLRKNYKSVIESCKKARTAKQNALMRHKQLKYDLAYARNNFCGIGTRKTKMRLNKLAKNGDTLAKAYRLALEAEDKNITAKQTYFDYADKVYALKEQNIKELAELCIQESWEFGKQKSDVKDAKYIIYFDLPNCDQISFHTNLDCSEYPSYEKEWDGKICSTLQKLEKTISEFLGPENLK